MRRGNKLSVLQPFQAFSLACWSRTRHHTHQGTIVTRERSIFVQITKHDPFISWSQTRCWWLVLEQPLLWGASMWPQISAQSSTLQDHCQQVQLPQEEEKQQHGFRKVETRSTRCREYVFISQQPLLPSPGGVKAPPANTVRFPSWRAARTFCLPVMWTFQFVILTSWAYMKLFPVRAVCIPPPSLSPPPFLPAPTPKPIYWSANNKQMLKKSKVSFKTSV